MCHMEKQNSATFANKKTVHKYTNDKKYQKVKDYCCYTDKYRGAAHSICNLRYRIPK